MSRKKRLLSIDTKDALSRDQYKLEPADFDMGSTQFDMPLPNFNEKASMSSCHSPDTSVRMQSALKKRKPK
jgi:hypothetical protein